MLDPNQPNQHGHQWQATAGVRSTRDIQLAREAMQKARADGYRHGMNVGLAIGLSLGVLIACLVW